MKLKVGHLLSTLAFALMSVGSFGPENNQN